MKRNVILFVAAALTLLLSASCGRKVEYHFDSYATMYSATYSVPENAGEVRVPVIISNANGSEVQVSVQVTEGTAVEGVDYELVSPASGLLTFSGETDSLDVVINIFGFEGEFTGTKDFTVSIASATEGLPLGVFSQSKVTINDLDHPLNAFIGEWTGTMNGWYQMASYPGVTFSITADPEGDPFTDLIISEEINAYFIAAGVVTGVTYAAKVEDNIITVASDQPVGYGDAVIRGFDAVTPDAAGSYDNLYYELQEDGTLVQLNAFGAYTVGGNGFYEIYPGDAVFTKK